MDDYNAKKLKDAKRQVDNLAYLPNVLRRKGVATEGEAMLGITSYNWQLLRTDDKRWLFFCEWVDLDGIGHRIQLPNNVCEAIFRAHDGILKKSRSEASKRTTELIRRRNVQNE